MKQTQLLLYVLEPADSRHLVYCYSAIGQAASGLELLNACLVCCCFNTEGLLVLLYIRVFFKLYFIVERTFNTRSTLFAGSQVYTGQHCGW